MKTRTLALVLWMVGGLILGQSEPGPDEFQQTVLTGQEATAADAEARRVQALVQQSEEEGAYQDGEFEELEKSLGNQEPEKPAPMPGRYGDE